MGGWYDRGMNHTQPSAAIQTSTIPVILARSVEEMYRPGGVVHIHTANDQESQHLADRLRDALVAIENDDGSVRFIQNFGSFTITELASALIPGRIVLSDASAELISAPSPFTRRFVTPDAAEPTAGKRGKGQRRFDSPPDILE